MTITPPVPGPGPPDPAPDPSPPAPGPGPPDPQPGPTPAPAPDPSPLPLPGPDPPQIYVTRVRRGFGRSLRPTLATGRPSTRTTSAVKSFWPRSSDEPTP